MPRIPVHTVDTAPEQSQEALCRLEKQFGKVLNIYGEMAHSPVVLAAYAGMTSAIDEHGTFDARTREAIALAVGAVDDCSYCQAAHTLGGKAAGLSEEQTLAIRRGDAAFDPELDALVKVVREVADEVGEVSDATWDAAIAAGWTREQLAEAFAHVTVNLYTNYFNYFARTGLDIPAAPPLVG
ncbi:carboxymuconolactone decarboxylase family protein [Streptomyces sp. NPDC002851]